MRFERIRPSEDDLSEDLKGEVQSVPYQVISRWQEGRYLTRPLPSVGYRYTGLFLSLCGYYRYTSRTIRKGEPFVEGIARIFLEEGELSLIGIRQWKYSSGKKSESTVKFRSIFSALYPSSGNEAPPSQTEGTHLTFVYAMLKPDDKDHPFKPCPDNDNAIRFLQTCFADFPPSRLTPFGVVEIEVGRLEQSIQTGQSSLHKFDARYKHLYSRHDLKA